MAGIFGNIGAGAQSMFGGLSPYSNTLLMGGLGMLSGSNDQQGFQNAIAGMQAGSEMDQGRRDRKKKQAEAMALHNMLQSGGLGQQSPEMQAYMESNSDLATKVAENKLAPSQSAAPSSVQEYLFAKSQGYKGTFTDYEQSKRSNQPQFGINPVWGTDDQGNPSAVQIGNSGNVQEVQWPKGFNPGPGFHKIDLGPEWGIMDRNGQITQRIPKDLKGAAQETAAGTALGGSQGAAEAAIPKVDQAAQMALTTIHSLRDDPARAWSTGVMANVYAPKGGDRFSYEKKVEQAKGQVFVQAFESLKGGGAISDAEGRAATAAITRLDMGLSDKEFSAALDDLEAIVNTATKRMRQRAGQQGGNPVVEDLKSKYGLE